MEYSKELMKHFKNPKYVKKIKNPDGIGEVGNIKCGDIMHLEIKVKDNKIKDIGFQTFGCAAAIASSDTVCGLAVGKTLEQAEKITKDDVVKKLKEMPSIKVHCSVLGIQALKRAIKDYQSKKIMRKFNLSLIFVSLISLVSAHAGDNYSEHHEMMDGMYSMMSGSYGFGWGLFGWLTGLLITAALVLLIIWLIKQIQKK